MKSSAEQSNLSVSFIMLLLRLYHKGIFDTFGSRIYTNSLSESCIRLLFSCTSSHNICLINPSKSRDKKYTVYTINITVSYKTRSIGRKGGGGWLQVPVTSDRLEFRPLTKRSHYNYTPFHLVLWNVSSGWTAHWAQKLSAPLLYVWINLTIT